MAVTQVLLIPEQMIATALAREELVALFNTMGKFSRAISGVTELSDNFWSKHSDQPDSSPSSARTPEPATATPSEHRTAMVGTRLGGKNNSKP